MPSTQLLFMLLASFCAGLALSGSCGWPDHVAGRIMWLAGAAAARP